MSRISDRIRLLSLITQTVPFEYVDNNVTSSYELYIEVDELKQLKKEVEAEQAGLADEQKNDDVLAVYREDLYILDRIIEELQSK